MTGESYGVRLLVVDTAEDAAREAAARLDAFAAGGHIALAGGSTPRRAYELAAERRGDWSRCGVWFGDERCVAPDDDRSNFKLARESLLDRLTVQPGEVHRVPGEDGPEEAATAYDTELGDRALDLVLLGLGPDGHTASLFPHSAALQERKRSVVAADPGLEPFVPRVTLTIPALERARVIMFLATGLDKAEAAARAFGTDPSPATPSSLVRSADGETIAILDREAAAHLA